MVPQLPPVSQTGQWASSPLNNPGSAHPGNLGFPKVQYQLALHFGQPGRKALLVEDLAQS